MAQFNLNVETLQPYLSYARNRPFSFAGFRFRRKKYAMIAYRLADDPTVTNYDENTVMDESNIYLCLYYWDEDRGELEIVSSINGISRDTVNVANLDVLRSNQAVATRIPSSSGSVGCEAYKLVYFPLEEIKRLLDTAPNGQANLFLTDTKSSFRVTGSPPCSGVVTSGPPSMIDFSTLYASNDLVVPSVATPMRVVSMAVGIPCPPKWDKDISAFSAARNNKKGGSVKLINKNLISKKYKFDKEEIRRL